MRATRADILMGRSDGVVLRALKGMTVVEVLVVMALLLLIATLVMPALSGWRDESVFESVKREIGSELAGCRTRAMRDGVAQRVVVHEDGRVTRAAWRGPTKVDESEGLAPPAEVVDAGVEVLTLPSGFTLGPRKVEWREGEDEPEVDDAGSTRVATGAEADSVTSGLTLVLYLPDGTVAASEGDWRLVLRRGGAKPVFESRLRLDGWTGSAMWETVRAEPLPGAGQESGQESLPEQVPSTGMVEEGGAG